MLDTIPGIVGHVLLGIHKSEPTRRIALNDQVNIGRVVGNDIVLAASNVSKHHARFVYRDERLIVVDLKSTNGTYVNGRRIAQATIVRENDYVYIGDWKFSLEREESDYVATDSKERGLLEAIQRQPHDDELRQVYGDWLEEQGRVAEAEVLSLEREIRTLGEDDRRLIPLGDRLRLLSSKLPAAWRVLIARPPIERCNDVRFELTCPKRWEALEATKDPRVRSCNACEKNVYFTHTIEEARKRAGEGQCVAIDIALARTPDDLEPPEERFVTMGRIMPVAPKPQPPPVATRGVLPPPKPPPRRQR